MKSEVENVNEEMVDELLPTKKHKEAKLKNLNKDE